MTDKILFVGTSFLGAIAQGWRALEPSPDAAFLGFDGPGLAAHLQTGWQVDGQTLRLAQDLSSFFLDFSQTRAKGQDHQTFEGFARENGLTLDLSGFSRLVIIDMFFNLSQPIIAKADGTMHMGGIPVSEPLLAQCRRNGLVGWVQLVDHPRFGTTEMQSSMPLITALRAATGMPETFLVSRPRPPRANRRTSGLFSNIDVQRASMERVEAFFEGYLARHGIRYLAQPQSVLDEDGCYTADRFSRGPHKPDPQRLDPHMNEDYGKRIVQHLLAAMGDAPQRREAV